MNSISKFTICLALVFINITVYSAITYAKDTLTIDVALSQALQNNYSIKIVRKAAEIADNNVHAGNAGMLPRIDANAGFSYSATNTEISINAGQMQQEIKSEGNVTQAMNAAVQLNWTLFDGFAMFISMDKLKTLRDRSEVELQLSMEAMISNLYNTYYEAVRVHQNIEVMKESISISNKRLERVKDAYEFGSATRLEILKAEVDLKTDSSTLKQFLLELSNLKRNINFILGRNVSEDFHLKDDVGFSIPGTLDSIINKAFNRNSSIVRLLNEKKISEIDYELINSTYYPVLTLNSGYSYSNQTSEEGFFKKNLNYGFNAGISLNYNLFNGMKTSIQAENAHVNMMIKDFEHHQLREQIRLRVINAYDSFLQRLDIVRIEESNYLAAIDAFNRTSDLYNLGQLSSIDFRDAQLNVQRASNRINNAKLFAKIAEKDLLILTGEFKN